MEKTKRVGRTELCGWYEATLPVEERKKRGHFSTPPKLVEHILDACGYTLEKDLTSIRVLDPACGSGNFLTEVARRLLTFAQRQGFSQKEQIALIQRNIWGFDPDPISCFLAEMQLRTIVGGDGGAINRAPTMGDGANLQNVVAGLAPAIEPIPAIAPTSFHIHQADGLTLPWEPCVDLFIANPPYLAAKNTDLSAYQFAQQRGQTDSYLLFLEVAFQVVRPNGWIGIVLPDPVLARANATKQRQHLLAAFTLHHLWHLAGVFSAEVGAVILIAQKRPPQLTHQVFWIREHWRNATHNTSTIPQSLFLRQPGAELRYLLASEHSKTIERLHSYLHETPIENRRMAPLEEFLSIRRGEELGRESPYLAQGLTGDYKRSPLQAPNPYPSYMVGARAGTRHSPYISSGRPGPTGDYKRSPLQDELPDWYPVLRGGVDVRPYSTPITDWWIAQQAIKKPLERYLSPKLLVVKSTGCLQAVLDTQGHIALQTLYLLHLRNKGLEDKQGDHQGRPNLGDKQGDHQGRPNLGDKQGDHQGRPNLGDKQGDHQGRPYMLEDLYFFLALLNSRLLRRYVYTLHTAYKWVQPQIEQSVLARLPIPIVKQNVREDIISRAKALSIACSENSPVVEWNVGGRFIVPLTAMYEELEHAIRALYDSSM